MEKMELPLLPQLFPVSDLDVFFRRHPEEYHIAAQVLHGPGLSQPIGSCQHGGLLHMMTAGMGRPCIRIRFGMFRTADGIQFTQDGDGRTWLPALQHPFDGCDGHSLPIGDPQFVELCCQFCRSLEFLEAEFRLRSHIRCIILQFLCRIVDHLEHFLFQYFLIRDLHSPNEK